MDWVEGVEQAGVTVEVYDHEGAEGPSRTFQLEGNDAIMALGLGNGVTFEHSGAHYRVFKNGEDATPERVTKIIGVTTITNTAFA